jgi:hypothetical protein
MRDGLARFGGLVALGLAAMLAQGCKKKAAPVVVQPVVRSTPRASPSLADFPPDDPPDPDANAAASRRPRGHRVVAPPVEQIPPSVDAETAEETQRRLDATLLKQQEAASQRQQQELNGVVQQSLKIQQEQQAEPRIQSAPEPPSWLFSQPSQPGQNEQRIQDAPGPPQTNQAPALTQPEGSPQL